MEKNPLKSSFIPPQWQITDPWTAPSKNDGQLRCSELCTGVIGGTSCRRSASTSAYPDIAKVRRSTPDSIALVRLGRNHHERDCKRAQGRKITKVQFWNFPASAGKRIQSEAQGAVESLSPPWYRPGKVVLNGITVAWPGEPAFRCNFRPGIVPAKSSWNMRFQLVPPGSRPVMTSSDEIEQIFTTVVEAR
jgi:hypothetical protein